MDDNNDDTDKMYDRRLHSMGVGGDKASAVDALARQLAIENALRAGATGEPRPTFVREEESSPPSFTSFVECVGAMTILVREDDGAPKRAGLIVDWGGDLGAPRRAGETTDPVLDCLFQDGWALAMHPDQDCPLVKSYCVTLDGLSATVFGPGDPPRIRLMNLAVTDGQWSDVSWVQLAREQGIIRILAGNIGFLDATAPAQAFESAVSQGAVAVADIPLQRPREPTVGRR